MSKKKAWLFVGFLTIGSIWFVYHYFEKALPFVHVSISMTARDAEQKARLVSEENAWNLQDYDTAVLFKDSGKLQAFAELEGGGKQAFIDMIDKGYYQPYFWRVRFFKEKEIDETIVWFTPGGQKNGFEKILPDDRPGNNLSEENALKLAESAARDWGYDLTHYGLVEHAEKIRTSKRLDHTFMYERLDVSLNKGLYRLEVVVSGDMVTAVVPFVKIPDEFNRRYFEMSSANTLITSLAQGTAVLLYIFIFGLFGLFFLYRKRYLLIKNALKISIIAFGLGIATWINWLPLVWSNYATTTSKSVFLIQILGSMLISITMISAILGLLFVMAESFDRYVFDRHIQIFKLWTREVACSSKLFEQTVLGYCMAIISIAYLVCFYMLATSWGWWYPLQTSFDPNILSMYIPFLSPCIRALGVGFCEELIFRVLPIAGILLLTRNSKQQRYWLFVMIIVQSIIFGAAHAFYPQQPAYFRIVELFLEFALYGVCYYAVGILPCVVAHFSYDALLMNTPIFISDMLLQKVLALLFIGIPLWVVIIRWIQQGCRWSAYVPESAYNKSWQPSLSEVEDIQVPREQGRFISDFIKRNTYVFGIIGILLFAFSKEFKFDTPPISVSQKSVKEIAQKALLNHFGDIGDDWTVLTKFFDAESDLGNRFVWQEYGETLFLAMQGSYVCSPYYFVRYAKFTGSVEERAQEYQVMVSAQGEVISLGHVLPESQQGADISEHKAKDMAYDFVNNMYELEPNDLELVSCESTKHEARRDWIVVLRDIKNYQQELGQAHIRIAICGDEITSYQRFIDAPESWKRLEQERLVKTGLFKQVCFWIYALLILLFVWTSCVRLGVHGQLLRFGGMVLCAVFIVKALNLANHWNDMLFGLNSAQPVFHQIQRYVMMHVVFGIGQSFFIATLLVLVFWSSKKGLAVQLKALILPACALACGYVGLFSVVSMFLPKMQAQAPLYSFVNGSSSLFAMLFYGLAEIVWTFLYVVLVWALASRYKSIAIELGIFIVAGVCFVGLNFGSDIVWACVLLGALWGCFWYIFYRFVYEKNVEILLITLAMTQCLYLLPSVWFCAYPAVAVDALLNSIVLMGLAICFCRKLQSAK